MKAQDYHNTEFSSWESLTKRMEAYSKSKTSKSIWQVINSFVPYLAAWVFIIYSLSISYWLTAFLIILAAGFLVRMFIIFHDCGHGSFFQSKKANTIVGMTLGILAFTPYYKWHRQHMEHHATVGNLDKRGNGDVWVMTREEYLACSRWERLKYRVYRNPVAIFGVGSLYVFLIQNRFARKDMPRKDKLNVYFTNLVLLILFVGMGFLVGFTTFLIIQLSILYVAAMSGLWLFYLQHQYSDVSWFRTKDWDFRKVAIHGSSYIKFPKILQWFSGNIGFHHIHHLNPRIPNYNLEKCFKENKIFQEVPPVTFLGSLKSLRLKLWDEKLKRMVSFGHNS
ncbi:fatty acid desaturase [Mangrovibacterium lignilyticum]|uniref:fatty acid desaturase n=1 Tax=Mangrovibacterium lignilyticum TaxID=2668052 RepID=UPI0013D4830D|nr:fatty acid desaturase [Mangrovibacterium lignilyticum]